MLKRLLFAALTLIIVISYPVASSDTMDIQIAKNRIVDINVDKISGFVVIENANQIPYQSDDFKNPEMYKNIIQPPAVVRLNNESKVTLYAWTSKGGLLSKWDITLKNEKVSFVRGESVDVDVGHFIPIGFEQYLPAPGVVFENGTYEVSVKPFSILAPADPAQISVNDHWLEIRGDSAQTESTSISVAGFNANENVQITITVNGNNIQNASGNPLAITTNGMGEGSIIFKPAQDSYSGRATITAISPSDRAVLEITDSSTSDTNPLDDERGGLTIEKVITKQATASGSTITFETHYTDQNLEGFDKNIPQTALDEAVNAYQMQVGIWGFNKHLGRHYDDDDIAHIYISDGFFDFHGDRGTNSYSGANRVINYQANLQNSFENRGIYFGGIDHIIAHEHFHNIEFAYGNGNIKWGNSGDWYAEGAARFIETLMDPVDTYNQNSLFYSMIVVSPQHYMQNPDRQLSTLSYDYAVFWGYLYEHDSGISTIERIFEEFRSAGNNPVVDGPQAITNVLSAVPGNHDTFSDLIKDFSVSVYTKDFSWNGKNWGDFLNEVSHEKVTKNSFLDVNVNHWASDYIEIDQWDTWPILKSNNINLAFDGIDTQTNFAPKIILTEGSNYLPQPINLDADKDGSLQIENADSYDRIMLIVSNAGSTGNLNNYRISSTNCDDKYDVKYWFAPGTGIDASDSNPAKNFSCIRSWIDHLGDLYWGQHHSLAINVLANEQLNLDIQTDKNTYIIDEPITFYLNITNNESTSRTVSYNISLESKDPENESTFREVLQTLTGELTLAPNSSAVYDVTSTVPAIPFDRTVYVVAVVEGNKAITTFEIKPSYKLSVDYYLIEGKYGKVNLTIKNNGSTSIKDLSAKLSTFSNIEVLMPTQSLGSIAPGETAILSWDVNVLSSGLSMLTFDISTAASGSGKISQLAQITAKPKLLVEADSMRINPGNPATVTANITNLGDIGLNNVIAELRFEDGLSTSDPLTRTIGTLEGRTTKQSRWTITGSNFGNYLYSVYAKDGNVNATDIETITIVEEGHGVDLKIDNRDDKSRRYTFIKTPVDYAIDIINTGTKDDNIDVYVFPRGINWTTILYDAGTQTTTSPHRVTVPAGATRRLNLRLTPYPQVAIGEEFYVDIQAISEKDTSRIDTGTAQAVVISETRPILTVTPMAVSRIINHNSSETFKLTVQNDGWSILSNIAVTPSGTIAPWITLSQDNITSVNPGESVDIDATISVPRYQAPGNYNGGINLTSENGGDAYVQISADVPRSYEVVSTLDPAFNSAVPGNIASYSVTIRNEGNAVDRYAPTVENSANAGDRNIIASWVSASKKNITLNPGISDTTTLDIMPPRMWSTMPGIYNFVINISSQNTFDTNGAALEVMNFSEVDVEITGSLAVNPQEPLIDPDVQRIIKKNPSGRIKVIIKTNSKPGSNEKSLVENEDGKVKYTYHLMNAMAAEVPSKSVEKIAAKPFVKKIELDKEVRAVLDTSVYSMNISAVYNPGMDGRGVNVAVLDTGIDHNHTAFNNIGLEYDFVDGDNYAEDLNGHGTHVAGIIASNDTIYRGVAPGATLMPVRVLDQNGNGNSSDVIAGIEWAVDHGAEIVSMSLGGEGGNGNSALSQAADSAVAKGVVVVAAAGNSGPSYGTIASPGDARNVITVGAINDAGAIADFSSRGATTDGRIKPDIVAPGVGITSTNLNGGFVSKSGTSMSTPHVSGAIALLLEAYNSDPLEIKEAITTTAKNLGYDNYTQGAGMIDVDASYFYLKDLNKPVIQNVKPGGVAIYDIELTNLGNINDTFNLTMAPEDFGVEYYAYPASIQPGWITMSSDLKANPGEKIRDSVSILTPVNWAGMTDTTYTFKVHATSNTDSSAADLVVGKLVINPTKRSKVEYTRLEVKWLSDHINSLSIDYTIKDSLLNKATSASNKNDQAMNFLLNGNEMQSNNMLGAEYNIINAFIYEVGAQDGKALSAGDAAYLRSKAELIKQNINDAIITSIGQTELTSPI